MLMKEGVSDYLTNSDFLINLGVLLVFCRLPANSGREAIRRKAMKKSSLKKVLRVKAKMNVVKPSSRKTRKPVVRLASGNVCRTCDFFD